MCTTIASNVCCIFAGDRLIWTDHWGCVQAWTALVWASAFPTAPHGPRCPQLQPPDHGFLPAHSSTPQGGSNSAGQPDFWVGQAPCGRWCHYRERWRKQECDAFFKIFLRDPSNWSAETMEALGPLLLLDPAATSALPNKVCIFCILLQMSSLPWFSSYCPVFAFSFCQ